LSAKICAITSITARQPISIASNRMGDEQGSGRQQSYLRGGPYLPPSRGRRLTWKLYVCDVGKSPKRPFVYTNTAACNPKEGFERFPKKAADYSAALFCIIFIYNPGGDCSENLKYFRLSA
jgi:hypothetical protein